MISFFMWIIQVSESDLGHGENRLVCQQTAVFSPATVSATVVTITLLAIGTRTCHPTCAHLIRACCSSPVVNLYSITWHPPSVIFLDKSYVIVALKLNKLFTVLWDSCECCQLSGANFSVSHIFTVTPATTTSKIVANWVLLSLSWLMTVTPIPPLSPMSQYTLKGVTPPLPSGSII